MYRESTTNINYNSVDRFTFNRTTRPSHRLLPKAPLNAVLGFY